MKATYLDARQQPHLMEMGCYGIGITRIAAAAIEQNHDERGIVYPRPIAPFEVCLVPIGFHKAPAVREAAEKLYADLLAAGVDVLLEDRDERPGVLFADMDLLGIPHRLVISEKSLAAGSIEYKGRRQAQPESAPLASAIPFLKDKFASA
jgi:prolyl-tRNA synthetase